MAAAIAANSARQMVLVMPAPLNLTTTTSVSPCPPVRDFEHEGWIGLARHNNFLQIIYLRSAW
eukprot:1030917-Pelagomonas_calceolata.AAC.1